MKLGDVIRGDKIGKRYSDWYVWITCPDCKNERWVRRSKTKASHFTGLCIECNTKRNPARPKALGEKHHRWKGGHFLSHSGYVHILLRPDDFFYSMANSNHYVLEHRLVMAKHLNRCLLAWEVVHHKGTQYPLGSKEDKGDNRVENLGLITDKKYHLVDAKVKGYIQKLEVKIAKLEEKLRMRDADVKFYTGGIDGTREII